MRFFAGADPDIRKQSIAVVDEDSNVVAIYMSKSKVTGRGNKAKFIVSQWATKNYPEVIKAMIEGGTIKFAAAAVEGQQIAYTHKTGANPQCLVDLAVQAGVLAGLFGTLDVPVIYIPTPQEWKGSVPKKIHQCRILKRLDWEYVMMGKSKPYPVPVDPEQHGDIIKGPDKINKSDWEDVTDSVALALWCRDKYMSNKKR